MVRALDKADAMLTLSSALQNREPFTIYRPGLIDIMNINDVYAGPIPTSHPPPNAANLDEGKSDVCLVIVSQPDEDVLRGHH